MRMVFFIAMFSVSRAQYEIDSVMITKANLSIQAEAAGTKSARESGYIFFIA